MSTIAPKLENPTFRPTARQLQPDSRRSDTLRTQDWFRHDHYDIPPPQLVRRPGTVSLSPAPATPRARQLQQAQSMKSLHKDSVASLISPRLEHSASEQLFGQRPTSHTETLRSPRRPPVFAPQSPRDAKDVSEGPAPRRLRSPEGLFNGGRALSPRDTLASSYQREPSGNLQSPRLRRNPSFESSDWLRRVSGDRDIPPEPPAPQSPHLPDSSKLYNRRIARQHSGKVTENSSEWRRTFGQGTALVPEPGSPRIANAETFHVSKGKKVHLAKESEAAKRRLQQDASEPEPVRSERRHTFRDHPSYQKLLAQKDRPEVGAAEACYLFHRTSPDFAATIMPETARHDKDAEEVRIVVGNMIVTAHNGRKTAVALGKHLRSDSVKMHLQPDDPTAVVKDYVPRVQQAAAVPKEPPVASLSVAGAGAPTPRGSDSMAVFGGHSVLPSTMPKDTAYLHSGLRVARHALRTPGRFSPNAPRAPASQVLAH